VQAGVGAVGDAEHRREQRCCCCECAVYKWLLLLQKSVAYLDRAFGD
jgi:hypothetical protein